MTDLERALADIAEVRERLGHVQRFRGYSAIAAAISGAFAMAAGALQALIVPHVRDAHQGHLYFALWFACCSASVLVNSPTGTSTTRPRAIVGKPRRWVYPCCPH
jgi:hypothetical protein